MFNFCHLSNWRTFFDGENFLIYGTCIVCNYALCASLMSVINNMVGGEILLSKTVGHELKWCMGG